MENWIQMKLAIISLIYLLGYYDLRCCIIFISKFITVKKSKYLCDCDEVTGKDKFFDKFFS